jgi:A/G-specific adenine glycosylase
VIEAEEELDFESISRAISEKYINFSIDSISVYNSEQIIHKLSHQKLHINFYRASVTDEIRDGISLDVLKNFPFPVVIYNFIEKYSI